MVKTSYPGSKAGAGVWQRIVGAMPRHRIYVEPFLGFGAVLRRKRPADWSIGIDVDQDVIEHWRRSPRPGSIAVVGDGVLMLDQWGQLLGKDALFYVDAPYLLEARSCKRRLYRCEMQTHAQHQRLLRAALRAECLVMISHYDCSLYNSLLAGWRRIEFNAMTRGGVRRECLWMNFPAGLPLHDTSVAGDTFRDRERMKRKRDRWRRRLDAMLPAERQIVLEALMERGI